MRDRLVDLWDGKIISLMSCGSWGRKRRGKNNKENLLSTYRSWKGKVSERQLRRKCIDRDPTTVGGD